MTQQVRTWKVEAGVCQSDGNFALLRLTTSGAGEGWPVSVPQEFLPFSPDEWFALVEATSEGRPVPAIEFEVSIGRTPGTAP